MVCFILTVLHVDDPHSTQHTCETHERAELVYWPTGRHFSIVLMLVHPPDFLFSMHAVKNRVLAISIFGSRFLRPMKMCLGHNSQHRL